jgi:hypothetical protein
MNGTLNDDEEKDEVTYPRALVGQFEDDEGMLVTFGGIEFGPGEGEENTECVYERLGYADDLDQETVEAFTDLWQYRAAKLGIPFDDELPVEEPEE